MTPSPSSAAGQSWPRALIWILVAGAVVRLLLWGYFAPLVPQIDDEQAHVRIAQNLVVSGEYAFDPGQPTSLRPPLYPAFVAGVFEVAGFDNFQAVRSVQALISLLTVVLVFRLGREVYSEKAGLWAAGLFCFYPSFLGFNNLILTEVLFTTLLVGGLLALCRGLTRGGYCELAAAGGLLGMGALTRSVLFPFAPVLALFLFAAWRGSLPRRAMAALAFALPFAAVLAPWAVRNSRLHETFIAVDCMGGRNFMMGNYEHTPLYRSWDAISATGGVAWISVLTKKHPETHGKTQGQIDKLAMKEGLAFVAANPGLTAARDAVKFFDFWGLERELVAGADRGYFGPIPKAVVIALGVLICSCYVAVLFAGAFGAALARPTDRRAQLLLLLVIAFVCAVHTAVFAHSRYHLPIMPLVMVFAGAVPGAGIWSQRRRPAFWLAASFCAVIAAGWAWNAAAGDAGKLLEIVGQRS